MPGGGPQGATFGVLEYLAQSNDNAEMVKPEDRYKFVDDLTALEIINLLCIQITSYDFYSHVPSDIPVHNGYIDKKKLKSQENLSLINQWTKRKKMRLNMKKTKNIIFNFTKKHKFTTRLQEEEQNIEVVDKVKLLGTIITSDLTWTQNTSYLVKKAYRRMQLLHNVAKFSRDKNDLKCIYITFIRPILEQSAVVWHSSLSIENSNDLERVQKASIRLIMGKIHTNYENSLKLLGLKTLKERRIKLCLNFAKKTTRSVKMKHMFPLRKEYRNAKRRFTEMFVVKKANTQRLKNSSIPYMQKLLNENQLKRSY